MASEYEACAEPARLEEEAEESFPSAADHSVLLPPGMALDDPAIWC